MKRLIVGACAALVVLMAALPAAAQTVPEPGLLRGKPLREYSRMPQPWQPTDNYHTEATDGDRATSINVGYYSAYRYDWDVPMRISGIVAVYSMPYSEADLRVYAFDEEGQVLWSQALPREHSITTVRYDLDLRRVGSLMVYRTSTNGYLYLHELEAYGEPEEVPPPPTGLRATPGDGHVSLSWQPVEGADSYDVEMRPAGGDWQPVAIGLTATTYTVTGLQNGQAYDFRVRAVAGGTPGDWSEVVSAVPEPATPPPPTGLRAMPGDGHVSLSWQPVEGADSYDVEMRPAGGDWQPVAIGLTATTYTVTGLQNGQAYDFRVRAVAGGTPGDWSEVVSAVPQPLPPWAGLFGGLVAALPAYVGGAVGGIGPIVLIPAAVTLVTALGKWWLARMGI